MKRFCVVVSLLAIILFTCCSCSSEDTISEMGDFSFELPEGYSVANMLENSRSLVYDKDSITVGGIEITQMRKRDLSDKGITKIMTYLQEELHKTNNVEFVAFVGGGENPYIGITLTKNSDMYEIKRCFHHIFFEKGSLVYHAWFDEDVIDTEIEEQIVSTLIKN